MSKKKLLSLALVAIMIAILSFSTLAWFNATDSVKNDFMITDSDGDGLPGFSVEVFEHDENDSEVEGLTFTHITPNAELAKDPTVRNTGDYSMYTRIVVTLSDAAAWINASSKYDLTGNDSDLLIFEKLVSIATAHWERYEDPAYDQTADTLTYVYYYNGIVAPKGGTTEPLFTKVAIPHQLQQTDMNFGTDKTFTMTIRADAIQSDNMNVTESTLTQNDAFKAFIGIANWQANAAYPQP